MIAARAVLLGLAAAVLGEPPGRLLAPGMQLTYSAAGVETPPWTIDRVADTTIAGVSQCRLIVVRIAPERAAESRPWCVRGDTLLVWDPALNAHRPLRPLGARMTMEIRGRAGSTSTYVTADAAVETISGLKVDVIPTAVTTRDSTGRLTRRLRERYAHGLATATGGVFEVADSTQPSGWRSTQAFELVRIRP
jgi:hypothetical protein